MDRRYEHKGLVLIQTDYNWHYMVFDKKSRKMMLHASCGEPITEEQAIKIIDKLIDHIEGSTNNDLSTEDGD